MKRLLGAVVSATAALVLFDPAPVVAQERPAHRFDSAQSITLGAASSLQPTAFVELPPAAPASQYALAGGLTGALLGLAFAHRVYQGVGDSIGGPGIYLYWPALAAAAGAGVGYLVHVVSR